jgi:CheY-like chemotaxis protein
VLLIEEHQDTCELYSMWLTQCGFVVEVAVSAPDALVSACAAAPDVVVVELMVPGGGVSFVRALRTEPALAAAVVIVLTTQAGDQIREAALAAGADAYLVKPCGVPRLAQTMLAASRARLSNVPARSSTGERQLAANLSAAIAERLDRDACGSRSHRTAASR